MSRVSWGSGLAASLSLLLAGGVGPPALAGEPAAACGAGALVAPDERAALARAAECERPVEISSARGFAQRQFAQPDGTVKLESYARPRWAYDRDGRWVEVDPSLVADPATGITTVATVIDIVLSPGGSGPLVTAAGPSGGSLSLIWPEPLPPPVLDGPTATYAGVFDGVDLQVTAGADWFSYALVVHSAEAAASAELAAVEVGIDADGLALSQAADGSVVARDTAGERVFSAGGAYMWDSSSPARATDPAVRGLPGGDIPGADPGRFARVGLELAGDRLRVIPDRGMLTDPRTEFPVTIDPTFTQSSSVWTVVGDGQYADDTWWDDGAWPRSGGLRMGFQGWTDPGTEGYGVWRSLGRFGITALHGSAINSASVGLTVFHTGGCDSYPLELWHTQALSQGAVPTSWNSTSGWWRHGAPLDSQVVPSANSTGDWCAVKPDRPVTFDGDDIRHWVQRWSDFPHATITFGLQSGDESDRFQWMRAYLESFVLVVNYTPVTAVPSGLTVDGTGCLAPVGGRVSGSAPVLAGVPRHSEGTVLARVEVRAAGGSTPLRSWASGEVASGEPVSWQVEAPLPDGGYQWRMRSEDPATGEVSGWSGWCGFTVDGSLDAEPPPEAPEVVECPVPVVEGETLEAADESVALLLAQACDVPVDVISQRDFGVRVLAQPAGTLVAEQYTQPQWAPDEAGEWVQVDPGFEVAADGTISTAAAVSEVEVSGGGDGALLTATAPEGGQVSLSWPEPLPEPVVDGATVTYPEVFDGVDLQVAAGVDGFSYVLVVKTAAAAASPELASVSVGIDAVGLDLVQDAAGGVVAQDASGEAVFSSPAAYMWDSSQPPDPAGVPAEGDGSGDSSDVPPGEFTQMPLELAADTLTVEPDQQMLTDPATEFPVLIDPPFSGRRMHWASVHQQQPGRGWTDDSRWPRVGAGGKPEMRVGNLQWWPGFPCGDGCGLWRSAIRFDIRKLSGRQIVSAQVKAVQTHTSGCGAYGLQLWYVSAFTSGTSWNGLSNNWQDHLQTRSPASSNRSSGCSGTSPTGMTFGNSAVRARVQAHANAGHNSLSFGFRSSDESSKLPYRRIAVDSVKLEVEYNRPAQIPTSLSTDGRGCATSGPGPWLTTQRPTLSGKPRDPDGRTGAHLQVRRIGSSGTYYAWKSSTNRRHNTVVNHRIPHGDRLPSGAYRWRMRSLDNHPQGTHSGWRQWCYFRVDATAPTPPVVEIVGDPPQAGEPVTLRLRSSDAHAGMDGFWYGINEEVRREFTASSGEATITFTAEESGGRHQVYVWAGDQAGNVSNRVVFDFFAARLVEATAAGAWRLDGDGLDDSGHGNELMLGSGVAWQADGATGVADRSLSFDGTGCVATEGPVVRTDAEYTVAAWVRVDDASSDHMILGQVGQTRPGFYFRYVASVGKWRFSLPDADVRQGTSWAAIDSTQSAVVGQWTHLAVRVDPAAAHMQMYVDGVLSSERGIPFTPWNAAGPMHVGCAANMAGRTWYRFAGAVHHVGVWQGLLTPAQFQAAYQGELAAGLVGDWRLRANGVDASAHARDLTVPLAARWVDDQYGRRRSAMRLDGTGWAVSDGAIVRTDRSFAVAAWVKLDDTSSDRTLVAQAGGSQPGFVLRYDPGTERWRFAMPSADVSSPTWHTVDSLQAPQVGEWYHLVGSFDRTAGQLRLYVNGQPQGSAGGPASPWLAAGPLLVGSAGDVGGGRWDPMVGTISDVKTWRGALTDAQAAEVYGGNPAVRQLSEWDLDGNGVDDIGSHDLSLTGVEGADYEWVQDRSCRPFRALGLRLSGEAHASTAGPVIATDESFTITAWVKLDSLSSDAQTVLAQRGAGRAAFSLQVSPDGSWRMLMPEQETGDTTWVAAESAAGPVQVDSWTHLAGVFDLAHGEVRLYVNGERAGVGEAVESPWQAAGPFYIGSGGTVDGAIYQPVHGSIDEVTAWSSTLDPDRVADMARPPVFGGPCP